MKLSLFSLIATIGLLWAWTYKWEYDLFFILILFAILFLISLIFNIIKAFKDFKIFWILLFQILIIASLIYSDYLTKIYVKENYKTHLDDRLKVIALYEKSKLIKSEEKIMGKMSIYKLPQKYAKVSSDIYTKTIYVYDDCIYFPIHFYIQGVVYCDKDNKINNFAKQFNYDIRKKLDNKWYWLGEKP